MVRERQNYDGTESWDFTGVNILLKAESFTQKAAKAAKKKGSQEVRGAVALSSLATFADFA